MRRHDVIVGLALLLLFSSASACQPARGDLATPQVPMREVVVEGPAQARGITVTGSAEVRVAPDEVVLSLGVETWDENIRAAKNKNDEIMRRALAIKAAREKAQAPRMPLAPSADTTLRGATGS